MRNNMSTLTPEGIRSAISNFKGTHAEKRAFLRKLVESQTPRTNTRAKDNYLELKRADLRRRVNKII